LPMTLRSGISPVFSYCSFRFLGLTLQSLIHFELVFCTGWERGLVSLLDVLFSQHHLLKRLSFFPVFTKGCATLLKSRWLWQCGLVCGSSGVFQWSVSLLGPVLYC
jgi:hypothetical protein